MPQIRPITDLRNTNEISELCHARQEPIFITKNGYGDLVIMSMDTYESLTEKRSCADLPCQPARPVEQEGPPEELCFLTEKDPMWGGTLAEALRRNGIPFFTKSTLGAGMALKTGPLLDSLRFYVPRSRLEAAQALVEELFGGNAAE